MSDYMDKLKSQERKTIKNIIFLYFIIVIILSISPLCTPIDIPVDEKGLYFHEARGVVFYSKSRHIRFWVNCTYLTENQPFSICEMANKNDYTANISGIYLEYPLFSDERIIIKNLEIYNKNNMIKTTLQWNNQTFLQERKDRIIFNYIFYILFVFPTLIVSIIYVIKLITY